VSRGKGFAMGASDLQVRVDSSKLRCVLDPALVLGHACGARLAQGLTRVFEVWLTRSFWQVLDASDLLQRMGTRHAVAVPDPTALAEWQQLRDSTDAGSWQLRWVGDCLAESQLRSAGEQPLLERYEWLAAELQALDEQAGPRDGWCQGLDALSGAMDALALSAALEGAMLLCRWPAPADEPVPVQALRRLGVATEALGAADDSLFAAERAVVREGLARAGLAPLLQPLGRLAVVHALADAADAAEAGEADRHSPWHQARAWWYGV
jgi:hypothetical protein